MIIMCDSYGRKYTPEQILEVLQEATSTGYIATIIINGEYYTIEEEGKQ